MMGGIPTLLSGDFRQILPVVQKGTRAQAVDASLKRSVLWEAIVQLRLTANMRVALQGNNDPGNFSDQLLALGEGRLDEDQEGKIIIPFGTAVTNLPQLIAG